MLMDLDHAIAVPKRQLRGRAVPGCHRNRELNRPHRAAAEAQPRFRYNNVNNKSQGWQQQETDMSRSSSTDIQAVVAALREAIAKGELVANQRLIEQDICEDYGASRGTVRAALAELATEGLVERIQNRGARVRSVSISEAIEILEVRSVLEALCSGKAALLAGEEDRLALKALGQDMVNAIDAGDLYHYSELNNQLHQLVLDVSKQQTAASVIHRLRTQMVRHQFRLTMRQGGPSGSLAEHLAIIDAICSGDSAKAHEVMREHLGSVTDTLRQLAESPGA